MSTTTTTDNKIHVSISINEETDPIEFYFLSEKLTWYNLVQLIQSCTSKLDEPVILYYKKFADVIESLENQEQLETLLSAQGVELKGLRFYGVKDLVQESVYVLPGNAFLRLGELVNQHKEVVASSRRLARWVGILASFIAQDTGDSDFDYEFRVLEKMIERKTNKKARRGGDRQTGPSATADAEFIVIEDGEEGEEEQDPREAFFAGRGRCGIHGGPFGCGRRGGAEFFGGGRGDRLHGEEFFGRGGPFAATGRGGFFGHGRGGKHHPFGGRGHHFGGEEVGEEFGADRGGRGGHHHHFGGRRGGHHHGGPFCGYPLDREGPFSFGPDGEECRRGCGGYPLRDALFGNDEKRGRDDFGFYSGGEEEGHKRGEKYRGGDRRMRHHRYPYRGRFTSSSSEESDDEMCALRKQMLKTHLKHGHRGGRKEHHHHFHFVA